MRKIGRNEPCPCGSGKKYKKCCGHYTNTQNTVINNELYQAHQELISYTTTDYKDLIDEQYADIESTFTLDEEMKEVHHTGITPWIVSSVPCLKNEETILEKFRHSIEQRLSPYSREVLFRWLHVEPSIYEVISVNAPQDNFVQIKEVDSQDTYTIPYQHEGDFSENMLLIGTLVPFVNHHDFLLTMVKLIPEDVSAYADLLEKYKNEIQNKFPQFLAHVLQYDPEETDVAWEEPIHAEVAEVFSTHLQDKNVETFVIEESISAWNTFCTQVSPTIKKVEPYAAAMDYYTQRNILQESQVKQSEIANEYYTSASTLSNIYRRIVEAL